MADFYIDLLETWPTRLVGNVYALSLGNLLTFWTKKSRKVSLQDLQNLWWLSGDGKNPGKWLWLDKAISEILKPQKMVLCSSPETVSFKKILNLPGLQFNQFNSRNRMSILSTPLPNGWTIPLNPLPILARSFIVVHQQLKSSKKSKASQSEWAWHIDVNRKLTVLHKWHYIVAIFLPVSPKSKVNN